MATPRLDPSPPPSRSWYLSRNLPHFDSPSVIQAITYRLSDSLPRRIVERLADELEPDGEAAYRHRIEGALDAGHGCCCLSDPYLAAEVVGTWRHFAGVRYRLHAWCVMPNHVHVLVTTRPGHALGSIVQSWKSWTGKKIRAKSGTVRWQRDYWDRFIRDEAHYRRVVAYIHDNPVKAGLVRTPDLWPWSSAGEANRRVEPGEASPERRALARLSDADDLETLIARTVCTIVEGKKKASWGSPLPTPTDFEF